MKAVLDEYPSLPRDQFVTARASTEAHPKAGGPYPHVTAKQALRSRGLDALDDELETASDSESE